MLKATRIVIDSKCDYPAACNAVETVLVHEDLIRSSYFNDLCHALKMEDVQVYSGPNLASNLTFCPPNAKSLKVEYGSLECCIEMVKDVHEAVKHIHTYGSAHTEAIVTENGILFQNQKYIFLTFFK